MATFFSAIAFNTFIVVAVLKAITVVPASIARASQQTPLPQPQPFLARATGTSKPTNSPTPVPMVIAINHSVKTQLEVTAIHLIKFAPSA